MTYDDLVSHISQSGSTQLLAKLLGTSIYKLFGGTASAGQPDQTFRTYEKRILTAGAVSSLINEIT